MGGNLVHRIYRKDAKDAREEQFEVICRHFAILLFVYYILLFVVIRVINTFHEHFTVIDSVG